MTVTEIIALIAAAGGGALLGKLVDKWLNRKTDKFALIKLKDEQGAVVLEGEIKISEYYKKELREWIMKHEALEKKFDDKIKDYEMCKASIRDMNIRADDLQRQITVLKTLRN